MNPKDFIELKTQVENIESVVIEVEKKIAALKIDHQLYLRANKPIKPAVACKVAFDANGLIVGFQDLTLSDIPELPISKVTGLEDRVKALSEKLADVLSVMKDLQRESGIGPVVQTGIKTNVDKNGHVVSMGDLIPEDIPQLPISKIEGLEEIIESLKTSAKSPVSLTVEKSPTDVNRHKITMNDIPSELISRVNEIEAKFADFAPMHVVNTLSKSVSNKMDANTPIRPGTFTKVSVDSKGTVRNGGQLSLSDLPELTTDDIRDLPRLLRAKADRADLNSVLETVSTLASTDKKISEVLKLGTAISTKAEDSEVKDIARKVTRLQDAVTSLSEQASGEMVMEELKKIMGEVSALSGRVNTLEQQS